ncbi:MAG: beta-propeller domain-containing protein [Patescibacteria group bacterium]
MEKITKIFVIITSIIGLLCLATFFIVMIIPCSDQNSGDIVLNPFVADNNIDTLDNFSSSEEFGNYIEDVLAQSSYVNSFGRGMMAESQAVFTSDSSVAVPETSGIGGGGESKRVSETNVQVAGIDEPDIIKTNGKEIFAYLQNYYYKSQPRQVIFDDVSIAPDIKYSQPGIKTINAFPIDNLKLAGEIDKQGEMMLYKNILIIFGDDKIYGYDISDASNPDEVWTVDLSDRRTYLLTSRLYEDTIYLVLNTYLTPDTICPMSLFEDARGEVELGCKYIYHPTAPVSVDTTYTVVKLDPITGTVGERVSFIGSSLSSQIYMSENAVYVSYYYQGDIIAYMFNFFKENEGLAPSWLMEKIKKLANYDISDQSKLTELTALFQKWQNGLDKDERLMLENEIQNKMSDYTKRHKRDLEKTGIAKIVLNNMQVDNAGSVPGVLLNQFSMDEYENNLRVATTVSGQTIFGGWGNNDSESDVYVLDKDMKQIGSVLGMGLTERIYSVRFIQDKGYVVTFRQTDPFYVLDLSDPKKPEIKGELKIPGYSSYLHPVGGDQILGIGKEDQKVKLSLFDVADSENPFEQDKYILDEYYSEILNNHHAFLMDDKHKIFFIPGSQGGYIFSYADNKLKLIKAINEVQAKRALFIDDYLYIITDNNLVVLDENNWERVGKLEF